MERIITVEVSSTAMEALAPVKFGSIDSDIQCAPEDPLIKLAIALAASSELQVDLPFR